MYVPTEIIYQSETVRKVLWTVLEQSGKILFCLTILSEEEPPGTNLHRKIPSICSSMKVLTEPTEGYILSAKS